MTTIAAHLLATGQPTDTPLLYATAVLLRFIAFCNPRKTGRHRMWNKYRRQILVRRDWRALGRWS